MGGLSDVEVGKRDDKCRHLREERVLYIVLQHARSRTILEAL